jgi:hypothetical protein
MQGLKVPMAYKRIAYLSGYASYYSYLLIATVLIFTRSGFLLALHFTWGLSVQFSN